MADHALFRHDCSPVVKLLRRLVDILHVPHKRTILHKLFSALSTFDRLLLILSASMRERVDVERVNGFELERAEPARNRSGSLVDYIVLLL